MDPGHVEGQPSGFSEIDDSRKASHVSSVMVHIAGRIIIEQVALRIALENSTRILQDLSTGLLSAVTALRNISLTKGVSSQLGRQDCNCRSRVVLCIRVSTAPTTVQEDDATKSNGFSRARILDAYG